MKRRPGRVFFLRRINKASAPIKEKARVIYRRTVAFIEARPLTSFVILLTLLFAFIAIGSLVGQPKDEIKPEAVVKDVEIFKAGPSARITLHAEVDKSQVLQIVAQTSGIVSKVHVKEDESVPKGKTLISLSSNYQGGNPASVQQQIASVQAKNVNETYNLQKDIIQKQREVAEKTDASSDEIRDITTKSLDDTRSLISTNESILSSIDANIRTLEASNVGGANDTQILAAKQQKSQFLTSTSQARSQLRANELQASSDKPAAELSNLQKDLSLKQLSLQESQLNLNRTVTGLQVRLAQVQEATFFPTSPFRAKVERVYVDPGETVSPGTPLVTINGNQNVTTAIAKVPQSIAKSVSSVSPSYLIMDDKRVELTPFHISSEATEGNLYTVIFIIPQNTQQELTKGSFVNIEVPLATPEQSSKILIPLDAVHQTQDEAIVYVAKDGTAQSKKVTLGQVQGEFIEINEGITKEDQVIVNRNVTSGDKISAK